MISTRGWNGEAIIRSSSAGSARSPASTTRLSPRLSPTCAPRVLRRIRATNSTLGYGDDALLVTGRLRPPERKRPGAGRFRPGPRQCCRRYDGDAFARAGKRRSCSTFAADVAERAGKIAPAMREPCRRATGRSPKRWRAEGAAGEAFARRRGAGARAWPRRRCRRSSPMPKSTTGCRRRQPRRKPRRPSNGGTPEPKPRAETACDRRRKARRIAAPRGAAKTKSRRTPMRHRCSPTNANSGALV